VTFSYSQECQNVLSQKVMTKIQKIWLWIFVAMFAVPEILWSPVVNFYYEFLQSSWTSYVQPFRDSFLQDSDNLNYLRFVIFLQFMGLLLSLASIVRNNFFHNKVIKYFIVVLLSLLLIIVGFTLLFAMTFSIDIM